MQAVWLMESLVVQRQEEIRRQVARSRRRGHAPVAGPARAPWRVRLGWRLVEIGLRLALPWGAPLLAPGGAQAVQPPRPAELVSRPGR